MEEGVTGFRTGPQAGRYPRGRKDDYWSPEVTRTDLSHWSTPTQSKRTRNVLRNVLEDVRCNSSLPPHVSPDRDPGGLSTGDVVYKTPNPEEPLVEVDHGQRGPVQSPRLDLCHSHSHVRRERSAPKREGEGPFPLRSDVRGPWTGFREASSPGRRDVTSPTPTPRSQWVRSLTRDLDSSLFYPSSPSPSRVSRRDG